MTEEEILEMLTFFECVVLLSVNLYMLRQLFSSISVNTDFNNTCIHLHTSYVGRHSATIHLDFRKYLSLTTII